MRRRKSELSPPRQRLVELMQRINFGRIEALELRDGEPVLDPSAHIVRSIRLGIATTTSRPESGLRDFVLKDRVVDLFDRIDEVHTGQVDRIDIQEGLPVQIQLRGL